MPLLQWWCVLVFTYYASRIMLSHVARPDKSGFKATGAKGNFELMNPLL